MAHLREIVASLLGDDRLNAVLHENSNESLLTGLGAESGLSTGEIPDSL